MKNKDGKSPRHLVGKDASGSKDDMILYILHSVGAKRCPESSSKCPDGCNAKGTYNGIPPPVQAETTDQREHIQEVLATSFGRGRNSLPQIGQQLLNHQLQRREKPTLIDTTAEQKGASVMDALLGIFSRSIQAAAKKESPTLEKATSTRDDDDDSINMNLDDHMDGGAEEQVNYGRGRLLCLDGGGIRGLVLVQMLLEIETLSQVPIHHMFDWIAGTSTGGILALGLGVGKTMRQALCLYLRMKDKAFIGSRPYPSENLEEVLKENLGEYTTMADIKHPKIMVTGLMCDRKPVDLHLFRSYKSASDILGIVTPTSNRR
jgi:calcium-independent phospholipase A2